MFEGGFMVCFFTHELREAKVREFLTLKHESITPEMVVDMRSMMSLFVSGQSRLSSKAGYDPMLIVEIDIERPMIHVQQVEEDKLKDREEFHNEMAKTIGNDSEQKKVENVNRPTFQ
ncbi:hypothetical protein H5410_003841 [Solanum commersonii]|uniref:Uncharacterized protein n=1 Tax=Solanum commersonii TaxID=4109 RepID=A0A9J6B6B5_SOLCO|nr:hypothetical protein H5410_003841 [Solanum commersonii]